MKMNTINKLVKALSSLTPSFWRGMGGGFLLLFLPLLLACSDDLGNEPVASSRTNAATRLVVLKDSVALGDVLTVSMGATTTLLGIDSDGDWTATLSDTSWVDVSNHAGYGYSDRWSFLKLNVKKNTGDARTALLTVKTKSQQQVITVTQRGTGTDAGDTFPSSWATLEEWHLGYNLGNTLDANPTSATGDGWWEQRWADRTPTTADWETSWGQPLTTPEIINAIAQRGFNVFRIPVTWFIHMDANDQVDALWMARVKEVVDMVLATGSYCILNVQHDTGAAATAWLIASMDAYNNGAADRYKKLWTQIATTFRDYGDHLLFESFNEILYTNSDAGWTVPVAGSDAYEAVRRYHQDFVSTVRATGGNNEYRNLVINPYSASSDQVVLDELVVPSDRHANHILLSVHSYDPYNFCNDNGQWSILTFNDECRETIDQVFQRVTRCASNLGIPAFFGEFGAIDGKKEPSERIKYATYMGQKFKAAATTGLWWMGLFDRATLTWSEAEIVEALFKALQ